MMTMPANLEAEYLKIVKEHQKIIFKVCNMYFERKEDREDLFQEITLKVWNAFPSFKRESKITTWLYRIALNTAIDAVRKKKNLMISMGDEFDREMEESDFSKEENLTALHKAIEKLTEVEKAIITLFFEEYTYKEIGEVMGISENYVAVKMNRIKNFLKENVK